MKPKPGTNLEELRRLAREEALAYQSIYGWYPTSGTDPVWSGLQIELHSATYGAVKRAIRERVEMPGWDEQRECATDYPDLRPCWRIYPISYNPSFPPLVRCQAGRTFLPHELPGQLHTWQQWAAETARGDHDDYLRELHWYETADWVRYHWSCLHAAAVDALTATGAWAHRPETIVVRDEILRLPEPIVPCIALSPDPNAPARDRERLATDYPATLAAARTLVELTRRWDASVRGNRKLRYYENCYKFTLDEFRTHAADPWLHEFFVWAARCVELGFGLRLDY
jgi:hypothetical protein